MTGVVAIQTAIMNVVRLGYVPTTRLLTQRGLLGRFSATSAPTEWVSCVDYAELVARVVSATVDVAWLPPGAYLRAAHRTRVQPVFSLRRAGAGRYVSAVVCAESAKITALADARGARAAWVDPWSAAGYLMPRKVLRLAGIHPDRDLWQRFFGSYSNVLDALGTGMADIAGVFCSVDTFGTIVRAGWSGADRVRVLGVSEPIAGDVLARVERARGSYVDDWFAAVKLASDASEHRSLFYEIFGAEGLNAADNEGYAALAEALEQEVQG